MERRRNSPVQLGLHSAPPPIPQKQSDRTLAGTLGREPRHSGCGVTSQLIRQRPEAAQPGRSFIPPSQSPAQPQALGALLCSRERLGPAGPLPPCFVWGLQPRKVPTGARDTPSTPRPVWCCLGEDGKHKNVVMTLEYFKNLLHLIPISDLYGSYQTFAPQDRHLKRKQTILNSKCSFKR